MSLFKFKKNVLYKIDPILNLQNLLFSMQKSMAANLIGNEEQTDSNQCKYFTILAFKKKNNLFLGQGNSCSFFSLKKKILSILDIN